MTSLPTLCCKTPDVMKSDTVDGEVKTVNRVCLGCYTHWYGVIGAVKKYTRAEWDAHLDRNLQSMNGGW